jgi:type VII secretion protein EccE
VQILWLQVVVALTFVWLNRGGTAGYAAAGATLLLAMPAVIRLRTRWLYQWMSTWLRFAGRDRELVTGPGDLRLRLLDHLAPAAYLAPIEIGDEHTVAVAHSGGMCAVLELGPADGAYHVRAQRLPPLVALLPPAPEGSPPIALQLVMQVQPAPSPAVGDGLIAASYRELSGLRVPAHRRAWLAVQVRRTPDTYTDAELRPALMAVLRQVRRRLRKAGITHHLLDGDELLTAIAELAGIEPPATSGRLVARETWHTWSAGPDLHSSSHRLARWPGTGWEIDQTTCAVPSAINTLSVALTTQPERAPEIAVELTIRLTCRGRRQLAIAEEALDAAVRAAGGRVVRLDGRQREGVAATMLFGGFL